MVPAGDGGEDPFGVGRPDEGLAVFVVLSDVAAYGDLQIDERTEDLALDPGAGWALRRTLDGTEPRGAGGCEVEGPAGVTDEPGGHLGVFVGGVIVDEGVDRLSRRHRGLNLVEEFLMPLAVHVAADHRTVEHVQRGEHQRHTVKRHTARRWQMRRARHWPMRIRSRRRSRRSPHLQPGAAPAPPRPRHRRCQQPPTGTARWRRWPGGSSARSCCQGRQTDGEMIAQWSDGFQAHVAGALDGPFVVLLQ